MIEHKPNCRALAQAGAWCDCGVVKYVEFVGDPASTSDELKEWIRDAQRLEERLREGATVLDEPFHHDALAATMLEAADALTQLRAELVEQQMERAMVGRRHAEALARAEEAEADLAHFKAHACRTCLGMAPRVVK